MSHLPSLDELWEAAPPHPAPGVFDPAPIRHLPEPARRYLSHAIAPGTPLATAVRLRMHGEIKLRQWNPFTAEQVLRWDRGLIWKAKVRMGGHALMTIKGADRWIDGEGSMRWKLLGLVPVMSADGPEISRSALGRVQVESFMLPSMLLREDVRWSATDDEHPHATVTVGGEHAELALSIDEHGALRSIAVRRWGNPEGQAFHWVDFGGQTSEDRSFGGYTIPTRARVGWYFGSDRWESEGEFFRATIESMEHR